MTGQQALFFPALLDDLPAADRRLVSEDAARAILEYAGGRPNFTLAAVLRDTPVLYAAASATLAALTAANLVRGTGKRRGRSDIREITDLGRLALRNIRNRVT